MTLAILKKCCATTGGLGGENGAFTTRLKVSAAVPGATTGTPRTETGENKENIELLWAKCVMGTDIQGGLGAGNN